RPSTAAMSPVTVLITVATRSLSVLGCRLSHSSRLRLTAKSPRALAPGLETGRCELEAADASLPPSNPMRFAQPFLPPCAASHFAQPLQFGSISHVDCQPPELAFLSVIRLMRGSAVSFLPPAKATEAPLRAMASDNAAMAILEFMVVTSLVTTRFSPCLVDATIKNT